MKPGDEFPTTILEADTTFEVLSHIIFHFLLRLLGSLCSQLTVLSSNELLESSNLRLAT